MSVLFLAFSVDENHLALNPWLGWAENTVARGRCWPVGRTLGQSQLLLAGPWGPCEGVTLVLGGHRVALHRKRSTQHPHGLARGGAPASPGPVAVPTVEKGLVLSRLFTTNATLEGPQQ